MTVRPYRPQDLEDCARCLHEGFFHSAMTPEMLRFFMDYMYVLIGKSSFALVAQADGQVVGFLCAEYQKDFSRLLSRRTVHPYTGMFFKWMLKYSIKRYGLPKAFEEEFAMFLKVARNMGGKDLGPCDCELSALSSRKAFRKGVGTALLNGMADRCRQVGAHTVRLFTNTDASYQFYDKHGFQVVARKNYDIGGHTGTSFVYEYTL